MTEMNKIPMISLKSARVNAGMTVADAAEKLGIHPNTVLVVRLRQQKWEASCILPSKEQK